MVALNPLHPRTSTPAPGVAPAAGSAEVAPARVEVVDGVDPTVRAGRPAVLLKSDLSNVSAWFPKSYDYSTAQDRVRHAFAAAALDSLRTHGVEAEIRRFVVPGSGKPGLDGVPHPDRAMDSLFLPATSGKADKTIIVSAGVHGAEGPAGTATIELFLNEMLAKMDPEERARTNILVLHGVNPWGYANGFRFDHDGVDNNRQSLPATDAGRYRPELGIDTHSFESLPPSNYHLVDGLFDPDRPLGSMTGHKLRVGFGMARALGTTWLSSAAPWLGLPKDNIRDDSRGAMGRLVQAMGGGQYDNPEGVVFGGHGRQPVIDECERQITDAVRGVREAVHFCVHTGLGEQAQLHMIDNARYPEDQAFTQALLRGRHGEGEEFVYSSNLEDPDFYAVPGDFTFLTERAVRKVGAPGAVVAPITYEFGTLGTDVGSQLKTTFALSGLNQLRHEGARRADDQADFVDAGLELFNPQPGTHEAGERFQKAVVLRSMSALALLPGFGDQYEAHRFTAAKAPFYAD